VVIVGSLLLILVAVGLLVAGVLSSSNVLIIASIVATVIAAIVLILGVRQSANSADDEEDYDDLEADEAEVSSGYRGASGRRNTPRGARPSDGDQPSERDDRVAADIGAAERGATMTEKAPSSIPSQGRERHEPAPSHGGVDGAGRLDQFEAPPAQFAPADSASGIDDDPPDEPSAEVTSPSNAARIAMLTSDVLVIDGRPRYHVSGCVHLLGRESEPLPVGEAMELGFSPCGMCEPDSALLAEAHQV
jgi:hypothetical protein